MNKDRSMLTDAQGSGTTARDTRLFVEAVRWRAWCGVSWRDLLAERFGPWHPGPHPGFGAGAKPGRGPGCWLRCKTRRACPGSWSTRRPCARTKWPPGQKKTVLSARRSAAARVFLRPSATVSCDAHGRICALALTDGPASDCPQPPGLLRSHLRAWQAVLADRAYDADYVRAQIGQAGAEIPGKKKPDNTNRIRYRNLQGTKPD